MPASAVCIHSLVLMKPRSGLSFVFSTPMLSVRGARPTAIRIFSASTFCCLPSAGVKVTAMPVLVFSTFSTFVLTWHWMPFLVKARAVVGARLGGFDHDLVVGAGKQGGAAV